MKQMFTKNPVIYKITSPTSKVYVGQTWGLSKRYNQYRIMDCKKQQKLYESLNKYGWEAHTFEIVHELPKDVSQEVLDNYEIFYWQQHIDCGFKMMNLREPGNSRGKHSQETKNKIGNAHRGKIVSEETRKKMSNSAKGKVISDETKLKISAAQYNKSPESILKHALAVSKFKGVPLTEETKKKISDKAKGRKMSPEAIKKAADKRRGVKFSEEVKLKMSKSKIDSGCNKKYYICVDTGEVFKGLAEVAARFSLDKTTISRIIAGKNSSVKFKFKHIDKDTYTQLKNK